jgi:hypothetical protein
MSVLVLMLNLFGKALTVVAGKKQNVQVHDPIFSRYSLFVTFIAFISG